MDMDDPWGSPWADEIQHPVIATKVNDDGGNDVRPKAPVKASTLGLKAKADSPWDDNDDGFGEWAAVPVAEEVEGNGLGFDGAGDSWKSQDTGDNEHATKSELNGLPKSWNDHFHSPQDMIVENTPSHLPNSAATIRLPSPDPWATENTLNNGEHKEDTPRTEGRKPAVENEEEKIDGELLGDVPEPPAGTNVESMAELLPEPVLTMPETKPTDVIELGTSESIGIELDADPVKATDEAVNVFEADQESSRPSSSPSDHDEILPESPRTSLDEEPTRLQPLRKVSSKIQGLVEHFDGLARQEEDGAIQPGSESCSETPSVRKDKVLEEPQEPVNEKNEDNEDDDDFGDFEEGQSDAEETIEEVKRPVTPIPAKSQATSSPESKTISPQDSPPRSRYVKRDFGRVEFGVDPTVLHKFYTQSGGDVPIDAAVGKVFIMDTIPYDSFQSLEERKTWYRISRYGSMRKHNLGDDENYIRVAWPQSQVREQTLKTVARWMEEDRISGRVVLGGGSKGSSIFGWNDQNAPAVPLASAFAARQGMKPTPVSPVPETSPEVPREWPKGCVREQSTSKGRSPSKASRRSSKKIGSISESNKGDPEAPVATFGWNASPTSTEQSAVPLSKDPPKTALFSEKPTLPPPHSASSNSLSTTANILVPVKHTEPKGPADRNGSLTSSVSKSSMAPMPPPLPVSNNDDEWGEMVESPVLPTGPGLPPLQGLRHKKSQSLAGAFLPQHSSPLDSPISPPSSTRCHKSTMSFDDILVPKPRNSVDSKTDPFPTTAFTPASASSFSPATESSPSRVISTTDNYDPWASADFSYFELPAPAPKPVPAPIPKAVSFAKVPPAPSPLRHGKTRQQIEQDAIVASIVKNLPDLSYMLRR
jgi:hypothetical protein